MIDKKRLTDIIAQHPTLAFELLEILANRIRLLSSQLDSMTFMQADARIAGSCLKANITVLLQLRMKKLPTR